jgi:hypothetical protein
MEKIDAREGSIAYKNKPLVPGGHPDLQDHLPRPIQQGLVATALFLVIGLTGGQRR